MVWRILTPRLLRLACRTHISRDDMPEWWTRCLHSPAAAMFSRTLLGPLVLAIGALSAVIEPEAVPPYGAGSDQVRWTHQESRIIDVEPEDLRPRWPRPHPHPPVTNTVYQDLTEVPE